LKREDEFYIIFAKMICKFAVRSLKIVHLTSYIINLYGAVLVLTASVEVGVSMPCVGPLAR